MNALEKIVFNVVDTVSLICAYVYIAALLCYALYNAAMDKLFPTIDITNSKYKKRLFKIFTSEIW